MNKRFLLKATAALAAAASFGLAQAQSTPIKFQLDWRFEGPAAFFLQPAAKGYFKDAKLDVTVDSGNGSGGAVTRVASGTYDLGFADLAAQAVHRGANGGGVVGEVVVDRDGFCARAHAAAHLHAPAHILER